MHANRQCGKLV
ncbi:mltA-interacting protein, partial [Yersinia pestis PY-10]